MKQTNFVIGYPLKHTLSPKLHGLIYKNNNINAEMKAFPTQDVRQVIAKIKSEKIGLVAVTMPHKQTVMKYLDVINHVAKKIKAVNTVINKNGKLYGYNTDIIGVGRALSNVHIKDKKVLIIGAGGAAHSVAAYIQQAGGKIMYFSLTKNEIEQLMAIFGGEMVEIADLRSSDVDIIINATPVGMYPNIEKMPVAKELLGSHQIVMDIIYNPYQTKLLQVAKQVGANTISGLEMFVGQAIEQVKLWQNMEIIDQNYIKELTQ